MVRKRLRETAAMLMIGDGVIGMLAPRAHSRLWTFGPRWYRKIMKWFAANPQALQVIAAAELGAGAWWAMRMTRR